MGSKSLKNTWVKVVFPNIRISIDLPLREHHELLEEKVHRKDSLDSWLG